MRKVMIGSVRNGLLIEEIKVSDETKGNEEIHGEDRAEIVIPLESIPAQYRGNLGSYLKKGTRFLAVFEADGKTIRFAGPIENFTPSKDRANVTVNCVGWVLFGDHFPVIPSTKRERIELQNDVWTVTGTPSQIVSQVLTEVFKESGNYAFPQSIIKPTGTGIVISHSFPLNEVKTLKEFFDDWSSSYSGYEVVVKPRLADNSTTQVVWEYFVGDPHYRKSEPVIDINIDAQGQGVTGFSYTENGAEKFNWLFVRSQAVSETDENWIDLKSVVKARPAGDEEYLSLFKKEFFEAPLTTAELDAQSSAYMSYSDIDLKTFTINVMDVDFKYVHLLGRRLRITSTDRFSTLDETVRITAVNWILNDPSSVQLTVQPADLRVYPRIPNRPTDFIKDKAREANKGDKWATPAPVSPAAGGGGGPSLDPWDAPTRSTPKFPAESAVIKSPITRKNQLNNQQANSLQGFGSKGPNQFTGSIWGSDKFGTLKDESRGNMMVDSSTAAPNHAQQRFYALSWSAQMIKGIGEERDAPLTAEVFKTRKFIAFPTWGYDEVGNPEGPLTDENWGLSSLGGLAGELPSATISAAMLGDTGPGVLAMERLASGIFFRGSGAEERVVLYFHQLQLFDNGSSHVRSKGFAFEQLIDQGSGNLVGGWTETPYPFEVGDDKTYYPETSQVESYGPERSVVTCLTPAGYWKDHSLSVAFPLVFTNTYWMKIRMGKAAIEDMCITKNYVDNKVYQSLGMGIGVFQTMNKTDDRWNEKYQLLQFKGELWATNSSFSSYYSMENNGEGTDWFMRFTMKSGIDKEGRPSKWVMIAATYGHGYSQSYRLRVSLAPLVGLGDYVFSGSTNDFEVPAGESKATVIAGKVGVETGKAMYGTIPNHTSVTFTESNNASGSVNPPKEFFPDFYDYSLHDGATRGGQKTWGKLSPSGAIIPIWNGTADNIYANEIIHGITSFKALNVGNWFVLPAPSNSYLFGKGSGGYGQWLWYGL